MNLGWPMSIETPAEEEPVVQEISLDDLEPLPRFYYPLWVKACALLLTATFIYTLYLLPNAVNLSYKVAAARKAYQKGKFADAKTLYKQVFQQTPLSNAARIGLFETQIKSDDADEHLEGINLLKGRQLSDQEYERVMSAMEAAGYKLVESEET